MAAMAAALLNGVLAASVALAGVPLQLQVDRLEGQELTLFATEIRPLSGDTLPVAAAGIAEHRGLPYGFTEEQADTAVRDGLPPEPVDDGGAPDPAAPLDDPGLAPAALLGGP